MAENEVKEGCGCPNLQPMKKFFAVEHGEDGTCHPCLLAPLASLYLGKLQAAGAVEQGNQLEKAYESGDIQQIAEKLDEIKANVGPELRSSLEEFDCMALNFKDTQEAD